MNESLTRLEQHEGEELLTELSLLGELTQTALFNCAVCVVRAARAESWIPCIPTKDLSVKIKPSTLNCMM